jgi:hypothetical protein
VRCCAGARAQAADIAEEALAPAPEARRIKIARDGYTIAHFAMIAGILYVAVGIEEMLVPTSLGASPITGLRDQQLPKFKQELP